MHVANRETSGLNNKLSVSASYTHVTISAYNSQFHGKQIKNLKSSKISSLKI